MARLASDTAYPVFSTATTIASGALGNIRPGARQRSQPAERFAILDDDEVPGLEIHCASRQTPRLDNLADDGLGHGPIQVAANRQQRADSLEGFHRQRGLQPGRS